MAPLDEFPGTELQKRMQARERWRHELTHYVQHRKGKLLPADGDQLGIRSVTRRLANEAVAYKKGLDEYTKVNPDFKWKRFQKPRSAVEGALASVRSAYPQGILKAMLKIKK